MPLVSLFVKFGKDLPVVGCVGAERLVDPRLLGPMAGSEVIQEPELLQMLRPPHQVRANLSREALLARLGNDVGVKDPVRQEPEFLRLVRPYPQNRPSLANEVPLAGIGKSVGAQRILCTTANLHIPDNTVPGIHCEIVCEVRISPSGFRTTEPQASAGPGTTDRAKVPADVTKPAKAGKGVAPTTFLTITAITAVVYNERKFPRKAAALAERAAQKAQELGLPNADVLNPRGSSMRDIAKAVLQGIELTEREE